MRKIFCNMVIAFAGPQAESEEKMEGWIKMRKGVFSRDMDESVTHLVCSDKQFAEKGERVKEAISRGKSNISLATFNWFEECCIQNRRLPVKGPYCLFTALKARKSRERIQRKEEKVIKDGELWGFAHEKFRVHRDETNSAYYAKLTQLDSETGYTKKRILTLLESIAWPHLYIVTVEVFERRGCRAFKVKYTDSPIGGVFGPELKRFQHVFRVLTGNSWSDRMESVNGAVEEGKFQYVLPDVK